MEYYRIKEKDTQVKITADEHSKRPTNSQMWSRDLAHCRIQAEDQELMSRKCNRSRSNSCNRSASHNFQGPSASRGCSYCPRSQTRAPSRPEYQQPRQQRSYGRELCMVGTPLAHPTTMWMKTSSLTGQKTREEREQGERQRQEMIHLHTSLRFMSDTLVTAQLQYCLTCALLFICFYLDTMYICSPLYIT